MNFKSRIVFNSFPKITIVFIAIIITVIVKTGLNIYLTNKQIANIEKISTIRTYKGEYGPSTSTKFCHKELAQFILKTCGNGSFVKRIPDFAFMAPNEFKAGLIQGYMDGDGNFQCDENHHQIRL